MSGNQSPGDKRKAFTGFHATMMFVAFFGVVAAVNFLMAGFAIGTFGGTVVDNSYVASQKYDEWMEQGRAQAQYGWSVSDPTRVGERIEIVVLQSGTEPLEGASILAQAEHPVGQTEDLKLLLEEEAPGRYRSTTFLPEGRWKLKIRIMQNDRAYNMISEVK